VTEKQALALAEKYKTVTRKIDVGTRSNPNTVELHPTMVALWRRRGKYILVIHWPTIKEPEILQ